MSRKSRVDSASIIPFRGANDVYFLVIPYDKRGKEILSSVNCAFNSEYYTPEGALVLSKAL
jgi:hypothetical protein